jgi:hypothetical protein
MSTGLQRRVSSLSLLLATCSSYLIFSVVVCPSRKGMSEHHILSIRLRLLDAVSLCLDNWIQELFCIKHMLSCRQKDDEYWFRYTCPKVDPKTGVAYYNDLGSLFFAVPHQVCHLQL